jgi:hypothetical protein
MADHARRKSQYSGTIVDAVTKRKSQSRKRAQVSRKAAS